MFWSTEHGATARLPTRRWCPTSPTGSPATRRAREVAACPGDNPDHSPLRLQEDVTAFVDSIGEPVCLVGWSAAARCWVRLHSGSVAAVAIYEPGVIGVGGEDDIARLGAAMQQVGAAAADGRILDAAHAFLPRICTDNEIAALEETPFYEQWTGGIPAPGSIPPARHVLRGASVD